MFLRLLPIILVVKTILASKDAIHGFDANEEIIAVAEAVGKDETRNGTQLNPLHYSIGVTMVNYGAGKAKVQQRYLFPDSVEVKSYSLQDDGYRAKRSTDDSQRLTQWVGGTVYLKPSDVKEADMIYINHPAQIIAPNTKVFHKISTAIFTKEGDVVGGQISSPNYPFSYPNGADVTVLLAYPYGYSVKLTMTDYDIEECCDRLDVYDGFSQSRYPIATFTGYYYPGSDNVVFSTQPAMFLRFTSDCLVTGRGFKATYINERKNKVPVMSCGEVQQLNGNEGKIQSPNYPGIYDDYMNCTWVVQTYYNTTVKFVIDNFTIGYDDRVQFYDGTPSNPGKLLKSFSGPVTPGYTFYASSYQAFVVFTSGYDSNSNGSFAISYLGVPITPQTTAITPMSCGYVHYTVGDSGYIESPNYPEIYDPNMNCTWSVQTYYNTRVQFVLYDFFVGYDDWVTFYDGTPSNPGNQLRRLHGSYSNGYTIDASSYRAFVVFTSGSSSYDSSYEESMFNITFDGQYNTAIDTTRSPSYTTNVYYNPAQCTNATTYYDYYSYAYIYSPGYYTPGYYPPSGDYCKWYISVYNNGYDYVAFTVYSFDTEYGYDWVRIYNGHGTSYDDEIAYLTGYVEPYTALPTTSSGNATMVFSADGSVTDPGFRIRFYGTNYYYSPSTTASPIEATTDSTLNLCGPNDYYNGYSGYIDSPNYPNYYYNNLNCSYWVYTPYETVVQLIVEAFDLSYGDYVYIYDAHTGQYLRSMEGSYHHDYLWRASTNYIRMNFVTNSYETNTGYSLRYEGYYDSYYTTASPSTCGGEMPYNYGTITSPNYPAHYSNSLNCVWTVSVSSDRYVLFTVQYFYTEPCCDRVSFYGGTPNNSSGRITYLQGSVNKGYEILIPYYESWVNFYTDGSVTDPGFNITYKPVRHDYVVNNYATTVGYDNGTHWIRNLAKDEEAPAEKRPRIFGKNLWGKEENKPMHLRKEKSNKEGQGEDILN